MRKIIIAVVALAALTSTPAVSAELRSDLQMLVDVRRALREYEACEKESSALLHQDYKSWKEKYGSWRFCDDQLGIRTKIIKQKYNF